MVRVMDQILCSINGIDSTLTPFAKTIHAYLLILMANILKITNNPDTI